VTWQTKIAAYCKKYNIPIEYLSNTLDEPKVVPMIRGKAFEFSVVLAFKEILKEKTWGVSKTPMNAQQGSHDIDVQLTHLPTGKQISVECKLAAKGRFKALSDGSVYIGVKCMRSRTLGAAMVAQLAPRFGVSPKQLLVHNDQYLPVDFDLVVTSIGNAFYKTDPETGSFVWAPSDEGTIFLERLRDKYGVLSKIPLKDFAFNQLYIAKASALAVSKNGIVCGRRGCKRKAHCGFIPNYPVIKFDPKTLEPISPWHHATDISSVLKGFIK